MDNDNPDRAAPAMKAPAMKVVVTGAAGSVGRNVVEALAERSEIGEIVGLSRDAAPAWTPVKASWLDAGVGDSDLELIFRGADAVIHLAWAIQPLRDSARLARINVGGSRRVLDAVAAAGVPKLLCASSVSAYIAAPHGRLISEDWPIGGGETSVHARHQAEVEGYLDQLESLAPKIKIVRLRPALTFQGDATPELCQLLAGPFTPSFLLASRLLPAIPLPRLSGLCIQAIHTSDLARAYALATIGDVSGAFNLAAAQTLDTDDLAASLEAGIYSLPFSMARRLTDLSWRLRLQPTPPDWLDMAMSLPLMSSARALRELGWQPQVTAAEALADLFSRLHGRSASLYGPGLPATRKARSVRRQSARRAQALRLVDHLTIVHAMGKQEVAQLRRAPRVVGESRLSEIFAVHLSEAESQTQSLGERLQAHGVDLTELTDTAAGIGPTVFAASRPDTPGKLLAHSFSYEHLKIAASGRLREVAAEVQDDASAALARDVGGEARAMAARLEGSFDLAVDASLDGGGPAELDSRLDRWIADSQAIEKQGLQLLEIGPKVIEDEELKRFFGVRLRESEEHESLLRQCLEARGARLGKAKDAVLQLTGMQVGAFLVAQSETTARLISFVSAYEQLEIAAYELLERLARRAGDREVTGVVGRILGEKRAPVGGPAQTVGS
jgi:nucleoside-diphosphate-sugar epimerase/ferritin-like metal-binding protein YciE